MNKVKTARITRCTLVFTSFFTRSVAYEIHSQGFATTVPPKVTAQNGPNRAGATPLFRLSAAQKVRGVAPARHADRVR